jgi:hypothetical protein
MSPMACFDQIAGDGRPWGAGGGCFLPWGFVVRRRWLQGVVVRRRRRARVEDAGQSGPEQETGGGSRRRRRGEDELGPERERIRVGSTQIRAGSDELVGGRRLAVDWLGLRLAVDWRRPRLAVDWRGRARRGRRRSVEDGVWSAEDDVGARRTASGVGGGARGREQSERERTILDEMRVGV